MRRAERPSSLKRGAAARQHRIDYALDAAYGTPGQELGNQADPIDEAVYNILCIQTDLPRLEATWKDPRAAYQTWRHLQRTYLPTAVSAIRAGALQEQKASRSLSLLSAVEQPTGSLPLVCLHHMNYSKAEHVLTRLPGLSRKGARSVMLYSLGRPSFPVDGNAFRIHKRPVVTAATAVYRRHQLHDSLQCLIPAARRRPVHVNLVANGQNICVPRVPCCPDCMLCKFCPRVGLPAEALRSRRSIPLQPTKGAK